MKLTGDKTRRLTSANRATFEADMGGFMTPHFDSSAFGQRDEAGGTLVEATDNKVVCVCVCVCAGGGVSSYLQSAYLLLREVVRRGAFGP